MNNNIESKITCQERDLLQQVIDAQPMLIFVSNGTDVDLCNKSFLDFFKCTDLKDFKSKNSSIGELFVQSEGVISNNGGSWLDALKAYDIPLAKPKVLILNHTKRDLHAFSVDFKKMDDNDDRYVFVLTDTTDIENFNYILKDVNTLLEKEVVKKTEEKNIVEDMLEEQKELLVQQSKLAVMGEMISVITHQWKQPLNSIGLLAQSLESDYLDSALDEVMLKDYIANIMKQVLYMSDTIDDFRDYLNPTKEHAQFSVLEGVNNVINLLKPVLSRTSISVTCDVINSNNMSIMAKGYANDFKQVLMNLIINAKDAINSKNAASYPTRRGGVVSVTVEKTDNGITITVADNGGGITPEMEKKLFTLYSTTKGKDGTGIGLYLCKFMLEKMGGGITAKNGTEGAVFTIKLQGV